MARRRGSHRSIILHRPPAAEVPGIFSITSRGKTAFYTFREIPCDIGGRGFVLHRLGLGQLYHVRAGDTVDCECECLGYLAHRNCKHIQGLLTLIEMGLLPEAKRGR